MLLLPLIASAMAAASGSGLPASSNFSRVLDMLSTGRMACPANINYSGQLDQFDVQQQLQNIMQSSNAPLWTCQLPLTVDGAVGQCAQQLATLLHSTILTSGSCQSLGRPPCLYNPQPSQTPSAAIPSTSVASPSAGSGPIFTAQELGRIARLEAAIWNAQGRSNYNATQSVYRGPLLTAADLASSACTSYVSDAFPLTALANLLLRNASQQCLIDVQLVGRLADLFDSLEKANKQCTALSQQTQQVQANVMSVTSSGGSSSGDFLFAPPPLYLQQPM